MSIQLTEPNGSKSEEKRSIEVIPVNGYPPSPTLSTCPYLGLVNDPDTKTLFPSVNSYCYRAAPPAGVQLAHQQSHCLSTQHVNCSVFLNETAEKMPDSIHRRSGEGTKSRQRVHMSMGMVGILLMAVAVALFIWWRSLGGSNNGVVGVSPTAPVGGIIVAEVGDEGETAVVVMIDEATETPLPATVTVTPTATNTPLPPTGTTAPTVEPTATHTPTAVPAPPTTEPTPIPTSILPIFGTVNIERVNVRSGPDTSYEVITILEEAGTFLELVGRDRRGEWWQVCCIEGSTGWVSVPTINVDEVSNPDTLPIITVPTFAKIEVERLNIRAAPDITSTILTVVEFTSLHEVVSQLEDGSWLEVVCCDDEGVTGWVFRDSVSVQSVPDTIPISAP